MALSDEAKELRRQHKKQWRERNREKIRQYDADWRKQHPEKQKEYTARYWNRKAAEASDTIEGKVLRLHQSGKSLREIAKELDVSHMKVKRILDAL